MSQVVQSKRLDLVPLTPEFLRAMLEDDFAGAERILGLSLPDGLMDSRDVFSMRLEQLEANPALQPWLLRGMALRGHDKMIGHIGFHTAPAPDYLRPFVPGGVEFGFQVYPPFRRQGYAREASQALMDWAHRVHGISRFVLSIRPDNVASQALAAGLGFKRIGSHIDEMDGEEDILEHHYITQDAA